MIDKLRKKVFWSILLSSAGVLFLIVLSLNILNLVQTHQKIDSILDSAEKSLVMDYSDNTGSMNDADSIDGKDYKMHNKGRGKGGGKGRSELLRSVSEGELGVIVTDSSGNIVSATADDSMPDTETKSAIVEDALAETDGRGRYVNWDYRCEKTSSGAYVFILNAASLRAETLETAALSVAALLAAFLLFSLLAWYLSKRIVRPAEDAMTAQKRFVADASHELKTPLTVIDANVSVLEKSTGPNKWLNYIKDESSRMAGLISQMLILSDLEENSDRQMGSAVEMLNAAEVLTEAALPFESVAFENGIYLELSIPEGPVILSSREDIRQLVGILIDNAIKHSPAGGRVFVTLFPETQRTGPRGKEFTCFSVANTGDPIPAESLPHIFDRFYKADQSRKYSGNSYGLGLAIAKTLVEKNGGSISAASGNDFTEFTVMLAVQQ